MAIGAVMDAPIMIMAALVAASAPHIETAPVPIGQGDQIMGCQYRIDGSASAAYVTAEQRTDGVVCAFPIPASLSDGAHMIDARYVYIQGAAPSYSERRAFEKRTINGGVVWTVTGEVVCNPDCVTK